MKRIIRIQLIALLAICSPAFAWAQASCSSAVLLTPATTCNNVTGDLEAATPDPTAPAGACGGATTANTNDVWFRFTATATRQTITVTLPGTTYLSVTNTYVEILEGVCGSLVSRSCQTIATSLSAGALTVGTQYYVRVYVTGSTTVNSRTDRRGFSICITNPPAADECLGSTLLSSGTSCSNTSGNLALYTPSSPGIVSTCGNTTGADVWYRFVAGSRFPNINLSSIGTSLRAAGVSIQLFSGGCGSLTSLACTSGNGTTLALNLFNTHGVPGLTIGHTYYIRIYTPSQDPSGTNWTYSICITNNPTPGTAAVDYSKSYVNISKNSNGGTVDPGDTLEIRTTFVVSANMVDSLSFTDTLFNNKGFKFLPGSLAIRTNEGKVYQSFTDAYDTDPGWTYASGPDTVVKMNFGIAASNVARGRLSNSSRPSVFGSTCILMVTYRVTVYAAYNTKINFKTGALSYRDVSSGILRSISFAPNTLIVYQSPGLCPNAVSPSNALGAEFNGTFGAPSGGTPLARNRGTSPYTTYTYTPFGPGGPGDYYYGIANNTSATYTTTNTWNKPDATYRVFSQWDITGDHTGASNPAAGNLACDINQPVSASNPCGYMLIVNSAYRTDTAFSYTITNLCPNTYYELSAWFKNICYKCGSDSTGAGSGAVGYIPSAPGDSSGVQPNIAFDVNGTDYFTTGNIQYFGTTPTGSDATNQWVKRGFTYLTGPSETSFTLTLRNNAPGGGGNDWALDDIAVATCSPNLNFTPTATPTFCNNNVVEVGGMVTSYFNNYTHYKWEKSTDDGASWLSTGIDGTQTPAYNGSSYEYSVSYPQFVANSGDDGTQYRLLVATSAASLGNACSIAGNTKLTLNIDPCTPTLGTSFISFTAKMESGSSVLRWTTSTEAEKLQFVIERSEDGRQFTQVAVMNSNESYSNTLNTYHWSEPFTSGTYHYRIRMVGTQNGEKYSKVAIVRNSRQELEMVSVVNPFHNELVTDINLQTAGLVKLQLIDNSGNIVQAQHISLQNGSSRVVLKNISHLPSGLYTLKLVTANSRVTKKVMKQ